MIANHCWGKKCGLTRRECFKKRHLSMWEETRFIRREESRGLTPLFSATSATRLYVQRKGYQHWYA